MNWKELLQAEIESKYRITENLFHLVNEKEFSWKPATGENWMTVAQLVYHISKEGCGTAIRGFVTGDWGAPNEAQPLSPEDMLPPAERYPSIKNMEEARKALAEDKTLALEMLGRCSEEELSCKNLTAPWDPTIKPLGYWLLGMIEHLSQHKGQLYYYLKLQGKPVNTSHLYGVE